MKQHLSPTRVLACAFLLGLLTGCPQTPPVKSERPDLSARTQQMERARDLERQGNFSAAAAIFEQLSAQAASPLRAVLLVRAADARLNAGEFPGAARLLDRVQPGVLPPHAALHARLVRAEILLARSLSDQALTLLSTTPAPGAPADLRQRYLRDLAEAYRLGGNLLDSARILGELDLQLVDPQQRLDNQVQILRTLTVMTDSSLELLRPDPPGILGGWMDLAQIFKDAAPDTLDQRLGLWRDTHPNHPALPQLLRQRGAALQLETRRYGHIAVLLPTSGRYAAASKALRDGLMASYYATPPTQRPQIRWYDTSTILDLWSLLQQAVADGAEAVIGPLQKEAVEQLARAATLPVPVLALNRVALDAAPPANLYQFGLSPEDEAAQAAAKAWQDGATRALALVPAGDWGERLLEGFRSRWVGLGGTLLETAFYDATQNDFSEPIKQLLDLDDSRARHQALVRTLGRNPSFVPRRRQDADALFLAANADKVRQLWPQLQFNRASDLPVYTTSHAYPGRFAAPRDLDLVGLTVPDMPWLLQSDLRAPVTPEQLPADVAPGSLARLFAMGMDSYRLLAALERLKEFPTASLDGATGNLSLDALNQVQRQLMWARIGPQGPEILGFGPALRGEAAPLPQAQPVAVPVPAHAPPP
jgi:outer membrane PBP1 activator LpoA protein